MGKITTAQLPCEKREGLSGDDVRDDEARAVQGRDEHEDVLLGEIAHEDS